MLAEPGLALDQLTGWAFLFDAVTFAQDGDEEGRQSSMRARHIGRTSPADCWLSVMPHRRSTSPQITPRPAHSPLKEENVSCQLVALGVHIFER